MNLREIDALVAEHIMGWFSAGGAGWYTPDGHCISNAASFRPSVDVAMAWEVVEEFMRNGTDFFLYANFQGSTEGSRWRAGRTPIHVGEGTYAEAETAPLAICLAALKARGIEVPQ